MQNFFKMMIASTLGVFIAGMILTFFSFIFMLGVLFSLGNEPAFNLQRNSVLKLNLNGIITERENSSPFDFLISGNNAPVHGLNDILSAIEKAKHNNNIVGIYIHAGQMITGYATIQPIRKALIDFKESGKFVIAYGDNFNHRSYYIASVADEIYMNPDGIFDFRGLSTSIQFNKKVFENWGMEMQVFKVGTFKSAVEPFIDNKMSEANKQQVTSYLNDIWQTLLTDISINRNIPVEDLNKYADECLTFAPSQQILNYNLVDGLTYGIDGYIKALIGLDKKDKIKYPNVKNMKSVPDYSHKKGGNEIAILYAEGNIISDEMASIYNEPNITAKRYVKELNNLKNDDDVKAVVLRVNSPGGSAYASEQICNAVKELSKEKPIVVSMGDYAASGGYYISCMANKIFAEPNTLTGSIGIFGLIPNGAQLAKKMGATHGSVSTNKHSNFGNDVLSIPLLGIGLMPARPLNEEESLMMQAYVERGYDQFLSRCAEGRNMKKEEVDAIGQGRVWTGNQALDIGLIDYLGNIDDAIEEAARIADLNNYYTKEYPTTKGFFSLTLDETLEGIHTNIYKNIVGKEILEQKRISNAWQNYDCRQAVISTYIY
ncbi:protease-4 [Dysgonomonadaceae bacterium PH5-43]|nr:protease-4 [Dysgonomonadaceae bacterium PH5-43]